ncbi:MAG: hypothetical protein ABI557_19355 [Aureliella sp.]
MSDAANNLIEAFSALPLTERHAVLVELARISELAAGTITDDELTYAGEQVFAMYDAEEAEHGKTNAG